MSQLQEPKHSEILLHSGRIIRLSSLEQTRTYAGLMAGTPNTERNDRIVARQLDVALKISGHAHVIPPHRRDYLSKPGDMDVFRDNRWAGVPEWLPAVQCIAEFLSDAFDPADDESRLTLVWFQDDFALPITEPALSLIQELDWEKLAGGWSF